MQPRILMENSDCAAKPAVFAQAAVLRLSPKMMTVPILSLTIIPVVYLWWQERELLGQKKI